MVCIAWQCGETGLAWQCGETGLALHGLGYDGMDV